MSAQSLLIQNQLCHPLYSASNALQRAYQKLLSPLGITYPQYLILLVLWEKDGINLQTIGEKTFFDSGTLTPLIQKLKKNGLIEVKALPDDRRNRIVTLTKKGKNLREKAFQVREQLACFMPMSKEQFLNLRASLQELHQMLATLPHK